MALGQVEGARKGYQAQAQVAPLTTHIGAEVRCVDLASSLDEETVAEIRRALIAHRVLFFREQTLDVEGQLSFARRFGRLTTGHPTLPPPDGQPQVFELDSLAGARADHWHTDVTFADRPPAISILRAVVVPEFGGDTIWANTVGAYASLPPVLRGLADSLRAVHTNAYDYANPRQAADEARRRHLEAFVSTVFETEHPVVRVHPESREPSLLLGGFARRLVGLSSADSAALIRVFQERITAPENTVRWRWREGDVAMWDNRATQHYAVNDYGDRHRVVQRVTVAGEVPVGIDGRESVALVGDASAYTSAPAA